MKDLRKLMFIVAVVSLMTSCQIYTVVKDLTDREEGRVKTTDGQSYMGRVLMPKSTTKNLKITLADETQKIINREDVAVLEVWKKTHPDKMHSLIVRRYFNYYKDKKPKKPVWMAPFFVGEHLMICAMSGKYSIPADGALKVSSYENGDVIWIAIKKGDPLGMKVGGTSDSYRYTRKALSIFLADDPALCKRIEEMKFRKDEEWQALVDAYRPGGK